MAVRLFGLLIVTVVFAFFQNCAGGGSSSPSASSSSLQNTDLPIANPATSPSVPNIPSPASTPVAPAAGTLTESQLQGTWNQACTEIKLDSETLYTTQSFSFSETSFTLAGKIYNSSSCASSAYVGLVKASGSFTLGGEATQPSTATDLDLSYATATLTPESSAAASLLNLASICGITNWTLNVPKTLSAGCVPSVAAGAQLYSIAEISAGGLFVGGIPASGDANDGVSSATRLDVLETTPYTQ